MLHHLLPKISILFKSPEYKAYTSSEEYIYLTLYDFFHLAARHFKKEFASLPSKPSTLKQTVG